MKKQIKDLTLSAMFAALGMVLPMITGSIPQIGNMLLPMHIPVFFCGLICGWQYGLALSYLRNAPAVSGRRCHDIRARSLRLRVGIPL